MPAGRPSLYSEELAELICERIASGEALYKLAEEEGMPRPRTLWQWLAQNEEFAQKYAQAKEWQAERFAAEIVRIADEADDPNKGRLRVDARKWVAAKLLPKKYGEKVTQEHTGADGGPLTVKWVKPETED